MTKIKVEFAEGCFDELVEDGITQEELNQLVDYITELAVSGDLLDYSTKLEDDEIEHLLNIMENKKKNTRQ